jgi:hypothetical protein
MVAGLPGRTGILTEAMRRVVREQRLGFVATVCPDGTPNLSPKGTTAVWDGDHLVFADLRSPRTVANLRSNPAVEVNVVDPIARKGYRFKGTATVLTDGALLEELLGFYEHGEAPVWDARARIRQVVLVKVERALPLVSPAYDLGLTQEAIRTSSWDYFGSLRSRRAGGSTSPRFAADPPSAARCSLVVNPPRLCPSAPSCACARPLCLGTGRPAPRAGGVLVGAHHRVAFSFSRSFSRMASSALSPPNWLRHR